MELEKSHIETIILESWEFVKPEVKHELKRIIKKCNLDIGKAMDYCTEEIKICIDNFTKCNNGSVAGHAYSNSNYYIVNTVEEISPALLNLYLGYVCKFNIVDYTSFIKEDSRVFFKNLQLYISLNNLINKFNQDNNSTSLPAELSSNEATEIFQKAITAGFCIANENGYNWNFEKFTGQLLAYFCQVLSCYLNLSKKSDKYGNKTVSWKPFEIAFGVKNIKSYKNDWMKYNTMFTPNGYEQIDKIFE